LRPVVLSRLVTLLEQKKRAECELLALQLIGKQA
jgi:hypothetical protein